MRTQQKATTLMILVGALVLAAAGSAAGQADHAVAKAKGKPAPPPAVTAEFRSSQPGTVPGVQWTELGYDTIASDGAVYPPYVTGHDGAFINTSGGLTIELEQNGVPNRKMWFDFTTPASGTRACGLYLTGPVLADAILQMNDGTSTTSVGLTNLVIGKPYDGFGKINFISGVSGDPYAFWTLRFPPTSLKVTRVGSGEWTIEWSPSTAGTYALQCTKAGKGKTVIIDDSSWVMPFKITVKAQ